MDKSFTHPPGFKRVSFEFHTPPENIKTIFFDFHAALDNARKINSVAVDANSQETGAAAEKFTAARQTAKTSTLTALSDLLSQVNARSNSAQKEIDLALGFRADSENVRENLLRETRERSAWDRLKPLLDRDSCFESRVNVLSRVSVPRSS